ncbi:DNA polymerase III subunit beta [bacterium (Candidatus Blackallbacteria) CG17_big_fil_post_rev_8_21_14_2_50_48_46]|uniref:Beta sliding clamp n=1 Tax=bacterium (Candidatus Blackallbacteria) CG17_big_fil_post_rev_8_21_14_2_50_48_46 TaxID=2014261 RepID=A0A2M7GAY7_9BACT|nr:MAG: DNA polymerase III subunit beta [bacterium (Candidatus Blackallbacteria) CG18_big_fil_WC_8_21_14_2_50_49_26]PIW19345.1 MAG: DNA polymerase III subunit beta [bacterium (Candidatus Blackallbacteria) CG17_big_fil_post_rev_8_21_14_2_50_48_46]PIW49051.1 MAG: DNA polymerase III subunit beta [bacterium (Candidatus Blackallbacteria) CG13_big_fil_rev_8_21_14_2_50_49_14]
MKITCSTEQLKKTLQAVQRAVASKGILPVLSNVLLTSDEENESYLKVVGTDLEIGVESKLEIQNPQKLNITIPAKKLFEIVNKFPDETIHFDFHESGSVDLLGEKLKFNLNTLPADDFPRLPHVDRESQFSLSLNDFCQAIRQTTFATATDSAKSILTGVNVQLGNGQLRLAATDGYRLAVRQVVLQEESQASLNVIIPKRTLVELERLVKQDERELIGMSVTDSHVLFESEGKVLTSRLIEGKYPDYNKILPKTFGRKIWLETRPFLNAVERVSIMASEQTHVISFDIQASELIITAGAEQGKARESVEVKTEGEPLNISFNANYLLDVLKIFAEDASHILLQLNSEIQPAVVQSVDNDDYVCMLMPIKP